MTIKADQLPRKSPADVEAGACSFTNELRTGELLTGTPTIAEQTTSDLTISNQGKNASEQTIADVVTAANQAATWTCSGGTSGAPRSGGASRTVGFRRKGLLPRRRRFPGPSKQASEGHISRRAGSPPG